MKIFNLLRKPLRNGLIILGLAMFVIPTVASAAWWNPISWFSSERDTSYQIEEVIPVSATNSNSIEGTNDYSEKIEELNKIIESQRSEISLLRNKNPQIKEIIKEVKVPVEVEKIVYINKCEVEPIIPQIETPTTQYDSAQCLSQKQSLLPSAENDYEKWWEEKQQAKLTVINECDSQGYSTLVCDNKLSNHNVEWQNQMNEIMRTYYDKMTKCASGDKRFNGLSDIISSSY